MCCLTQGAQPSATWQPRRMGLGGRREGDSGGAATYVDMHLTLKDELPRSVGVQYTTGEEWKNTSRKKEGPETKWKQRPVVDVTGDGGKVRSCKEQYCTGTWNITYMNQGNLQVVKQEMARLNINTVGISKLKSESWDHGIWSHHFMANRWGNGGNSAWLYFWGLQNHYRWWLQPWN